MLSELVVNLGRHGRRVLLVEDRGPAIGPDDLFSVEQLAAVLRCAPGTIRRLVAQGRLRATTSGGGPIISGSEVLLLWNYRP